MENYYQALNIAPTATDEEVKKAILTKRRLWSNRTNAPDLERRQEADRMVKLLDTAEQTLLNPSQRPQYDLKLRTSPVDAPHVNEAKAGEQHDWIREGRRFLSDGDIPNALYAATQATQTNGSDPEAWALSAQAKFRWGQIPDSIYEYKRAINLRPNEAQYYFDLGSVYESTENWTEALQQYQWASRVDPASTMFRASIGETYLRLEKYPESIATLQQCVAESPDNPTYRAFLAAAYADGAYEHWTFVPAGNALGIPPGQYATSKFQVDEALASVQKAQTINVETAELRDVINGIHTNIQSMLKRHFHGNWGVVGLAAFIGLIQLLSGSAWCWYFLFCAVLYPVSCYVPQYLVNRKIIENKSLTSGGWISSLLFEGGTGCVGILIGLAIILLILPVMIIVNFTRNYVMAPQLTARDQQYKLRQTPPTLMDPMVQSQR